jgi:large subunit ribosomal protein L25
MAGATTISAERRDGTGKGVARAVRRMGRVPAVIYGDNSEPIAITIDGMELSLLADNPKFFIQVVRVEVDGDSHRVLPRDLQLHPVTDVPMHVDFLRFSANTQIAAMIPVRFINAEESPGLKRGGVLNIVRREVEVRCSPLSIPQELVFDLDGLDIGASIHIKTIELPDGVEATTERDFTVATVAAPTLMPVEEEEEEEGEGLEGEEGEGLEGEEGEEGEGGEDAAQETGDSKD